MAKYALIESGVVVNTVEWDGDSEVWSPPSGQAAVEVGEDFVDIGYKFENNAFVPAA